MSCQQQACQFCFRLLPVAVFITLSISGKNWINRANNQDLWYDKEKQRMDETGQLCIIIERKTVTVRKTLM